MADERYIYGGMKLPTRNLLSHERRQKIIRWGWGGLNRESDIDTGQITDCSGVLIDPPYVVPCAEFSVYAEYAEGIGIFGFDDFLLVIYREGGKIKVDYRRGNDIFTGVMGDAYGDERDFVPRSAVQFNVAVGTENIVSAEYDRKILIFPDRYSMDFNVSADFSPASLGNTYPDIRYATVYGSRVFGADEDRIYASGFNDYANWDLDTADDVSDAHAWVSLSQSNVRADGEITGVWTYDNHVVIFKKDFLQLVYNNKNPFRLVDVTSYGADSSRGICECGGVLYFASPDGVYSFTGGMPKNVGGELGISDFRGAVMGSVGDRVYLSVRGELYRLRRGAWSMVDEQIPVIQFAASEGGLYALCVDGRILLVDDGGEMSENADISDIDSDAYGEWWFETDLMTGRSLDIRRAKKLTLLCDFARGGTLTAYLLRDGEVFDIHTSEKVIDMSGSFAAGRRMIRTGLRGFSASAHRLRIHGAGYVKIHAAELQVTFGGEEFVSDE